MLQSSSRTTTSHLQRRHTNTRLMHTTHMRAQARRFIRIHPPNRTQIERVVESGETTMFKSYFHSFDPPYKPKANVGSASKGVAGAVEEKAIDIGSMHAGAAQSDTPVDDGSGKLEIWRIEDFKKVEVAPEKYGQFYGGDSYVLLYTYMVGPRVRIRTHACTAIE